jgi:hypothetical protein
MRGFIEAKPQQKAVAVLGRAIYIFRKMNDGI